MTRYKKCFVFIINPVAGKRRHKNIEREIYSYFLSTDIEPLIYQTQYAGHAAVVCRQLAEQFSPAAIIAVGGDGTVNEVVNGIGLYGVPMGIIPNGSGNGLARHLGLPTNLEKIFNIIEKGYSTPVDLIRIGEKYSINVSGVGFDALVARRFQDSLSRGLISYVRIAVSEFFKYHPEEYELMIDGKMNRQKAFLISIANSSQFGNNILISPKASVCDGYIDLCVISPFPKWTALGLLYKLLCRKINRSPYLKITRAKKIRLKQPGNVYHIDGEVMEGGAVLEAEIVEGAFRVIIPEQRKNLI
ncbi:MAG: diacylglycerol kinase family lipid kinase [Deltaproteobacteria bacterium]|nr:diacylglycerol kinase family lipid kinase [Deltaproteobacteria bacterium]